VVETWVELAALILRNGGEFAVLELRWGGGADGLRLPPNLLDVGCSLPV